MKLILTRSDRFDGEDTGLDTSRPPTAVYATEAHHRITNNLSMVAAMLSMHADAVRRGGADLSPDEAAEIIDMASARIDVVAQLHRLLATSERGTIRLGEYLRKIAENAIASITRDSDTDLSTECEGEYALDSTLAVRIGFIVNELTTNALKYAHPAFGVGTRLKLGCRSDADGTLVISVMDDGVGLPEGFDPDSDGGLGMRTIRTISRQIGATLAFDSSELGLEVSLSVPLPGSARGA